MFGVPDLVLILVIWPLSVYEAFIIGRTQAVNKLEREEKEEAERKRAELEKLPRKTWSI